MTDAKPLQRLAELARQSRNQMGQKLAGARDDQRQAASQHEVLTQYREAYAQQLAAAMDSGIDLATLSDYQGFLNSLDNAIARAQESVQQQGERVEQYRQDWASKHRRLVSFDTLASRRDAEYRRSQQRLETRQQDEIANNVYLRAQRERAGES